MVIWGPVQTLLSHERLRDPNEKKERKKKEKKD
jgi:hypothetical protein